MSFEAHVPNWKATECSKSTSFLIEYYFFVRNWKDGALSPISFLLVWSVKSCFLCTKLKGWCFVAEIVYLFVYSSWETFDLWFDRRILFYVYWIESGPWIFCDCRFFGGPCPLVGFQKRNVYFPVEVMSFFERFGNVLQSCIFYYAVCDDQSEPRHYPAVQ